MFDGCLLVVYEGRGTGMQGFKYYKEMGIEMQGIILGRCSTYVGVGHGRVHVGYRVSQHMGR